MTRRSQGKARASRPRRCRRIALLPLLLAALCAAGCGPKRHPDTRTRPATEGGPIPEQSLGGRTSPARAAFAAEARVETAEGARRIRLRFYAAAPDRFRIEARGSVGGIALIATGQGDRVRIVLPTRRRYADSAVTDDLGSGLLGIPLSGCALARIMRVCSGMQTFRPCGPPASAADPASASSQDETDRPAQWVETSAPGTEPLRFGLSWGRGQFPEEIRLETRLDAPAWLTLSGFRDIADPPSVGEDFFWEPAPPGSVRVSVGALAEQP